LKKSQLNGLERLYRRRIPPGELVTSELASRLAELSAEIGRQVGVLINRIGLVEYVIVGDERRIVIPELRDYPLGKKRLRGLRFCHTHLKGEEITEDDLTDLALLRLDLLMALLLPHDRRPLSVQIACLSTTQLENTPVHVDPPCLLERVSINAIDFIASLENSLENSVTGSDEISGVQERAILISVSNSSRAEVENSMDELRELTRTAGVAVFDSFIQQRRDLNPRFLMGEGKMQEVIIRALQLGASMLIFDQELSPAPDPLHIGND